ncbi:cysteine desulfurase family protein [Bacillus thermotolerans]|uniref:Cysteine desulfurase n=1 Tax=Bacillus thermotolerans TaxID=1221996 RepID=A0A0F5HWG9_BACTR|nr:cysteine desulfurase family protein [Bacillus thermotolerans]KKB37573.1 Cysteine desulfurase [Bacillus thermotolerans]KKB42198.1 Cysteine desulfurase [Bacillus thermotolerans]KKB43272.1 Cysteine desulfurase [Bacillus thermotolerans]
MIYFDNSATTKPYKEALSTYVKVNEQFFGNPSSLHHLGLQAERLLFESRKQMASLLGTEAENIIFTSGGTEANNLAIKGTALANMHRGRHIITQQTEHPSVINACQQLEEHGFRVSYLPVDSHGQVSAEDVAAALTNETILVSIMHVNNETGAIQPIQEIAKLLKNEPQVLFHVDDVQGRGKVPLNLENIDLCTLSAHKFHGLKGNGVLYKKKGVKLSALLSGGNQESGFRSGTENAGGVAAMAKALRLIEEHRREHGERLRAVQQFLRKELEGRQDVIIHTPREGCAPHILNFSVERLKGEVLVHALEERGCYLSTTSACSSRQKKTSTVLTAMGVPKEIADSSVRLSLSYENTRQEAEAFIQILKDTIPTLAKVQR